MTDCRYGIVGCVGIGETHAEAVESAEGAELVACSDVVEENARTFAEEHDCEPYTDTAAMIEAANVDAVSVCTPSGTHADVAIEAIEAGADVLCEKPLDVYADRMDRMIETAEAHEATLAGVFQRRTDPGAKRAKEAVESGELGDLVLGDVQVKWYRSQGYYDSGGWRGTREMDGGVLMNQAIHGIDLLGWLAGGIEWVNADCRTVARDVEVETAATMTVGFENGAQGTIEATTVVRPSHPVIVELNGQEGSITMRDQEIERFETAEEEFELDLPSHDWGEGHAVVVQDFVDALREGREPMVPAREGRKAVDAVLAAYESSERNERVSLEEVREGDVQTSE